MEIIVHDTVSGKVTEIVSDNFVINDIDDTLNLIAESGALDSGKIILHEYQINPDFFDLKTKLAGEILQKFSNYRMQLAIIGDFTKYRSRSFQDFIRECNKGNRIFYVESKRAALAKLALTKNC